MTLPVRPEDLARFVPVFLASRVSANPAPPTAATAESTHAAVLFADISGFTALSERLAARGAEGVEELTRALNTYFGKLLDVITTHGGDVVKFAGDALLAFWPVATEAELPRATRTAAWCGLEVQTAIQSFVAETGQRLSLRVGVGTGSVAVVTVGGVLDRWEVVVVGPAVIEATTAAGPGEPGWVVLGSRAWELVQFAGTGTELTPAFTRLDRMEVKTLPVPLAAVAVPAEAVPALLSYVPAAIHRRLAARQTAWLAEMRHLTVLFVKLPCLNDQTPLAKAQEVMVALQCELYRYEGSVNKLSTDEKGVSFVAALGLPPLAHEDDPVRGTLVALAIHARLADLGWDCSVGVTTGRVFCGTIGGEARCEFTMIGDVVNQSARQMQAAKVGILCDERTYLASRDRFDWQVLPPVQLKGKAHPTPIFRPLGAGKDVVGLKHSQEMVGRAAERQRLDEVTRRFLQDRASGVILIEGEAGIGKSTLVADVLRRAYKLNLTTWVGTALAIERSTSYFVWRAVFRQLFRLDPASPPEEQRRRVLDHLAFDPTLERLTPLLDAVLALDFPPTAETAEMFGEVRLNTTNAILVRLLTRETEQAPLQLILDDCHWLDSASWALARLVAEQVPSLLIVIVTRPLTAPLPRDYAPLVSAPATIHLPLNPLTSEEAVALAQRRLGVTELPVPVAALLAAKAQGNPFFIEELAYALRDAGKVLVRNGLCEVAAGEDLRAQPFPDTVQGVVTSRIDRLAPPEQLTLKVASVIGRTFSKTLLRDVSPIEDDKPNLDRYLDVLIAQSLTMLETPDPDPAYSFRHVITQEVSYEMMPPAQRKRLHQVVAEWYEREHRQDLSPHYPLLARHWSSTDCAAKAIDYLEKSGENAMRDCAHEEAVTFFTQALALDEQAGRVGDRFRRACWWRQLAEAYYHLSDLSTARRHYQTALDLLGYPSPRRAVRGVVAAVWEFTRQLAHRAFPRWFLGKWKDQAPARLEAARAYERLVQIHYLNNAKVPSIHAAYRALNLSEGVGECPELARNYAHAAVFSGLLMMHRSARAYARRAREMAGRVNQQSCTAYVEFIRGVYWVTVGEWEEAERDLTIAVEITDRIGERRRWYESGFTLANTLSRKGDYPASFALAEKLARAGTARGVPQVQVWGLSWQLSCLLSLEQGGERLRPLEENLASCLAAHSTIPLADQILGHGLSALARWRRGEKKLGEQAAEAAERIIAETNQISHYLPPAYAGLAEVYFGLWADRPDDPAFAREMARRVRRLCSTLRQFSLMYPIGAPTALLVRGEYEWRRGRPARAVRLWRRSLAAAERYRMPYEQGLAHAKLARRLSAADPLAEAHRIQARELFSRIGAVADGHRLDVPYSQP
ncbi:MAG TPA: adenylate/guanylate cyclase domain-containing protein [Fimbriiglobus sp.]|jgi:class 3 adenylate cyclase/tetratricopeptide (TPR) repeat protein